jgi:hypothetical protein
MIAVSYNRAAFRGEFGRILGSVERPVAILKAAGRELANQLRKHFRMKDRAPNTLSPRREHFWLQIMRSVNEPEQTGYNAISVRISDPRMAQKVFGGPIVAKAAGALTIPVEERAYGRRASTFEAETGLKLFIVRTGKGKTGNAVLAVAEGKGITVEYILTKSVDQEADPTALPEMGMLEQAILARAQAVADRQRET